MAFIIDSYCKYDQWDREHARKVFEVNDRQYAIFEVELEWGLPQFPTRIGSEKRLEQYFIYDTYEDASKFVRLMKGLN